jgi:hypothetical protein
MNTYFEVKFNRAEYNKTYSTMSEVILAIEKALNKDRVIAETIVEKDKKTDRVTTIYKPNFSAKLEWTEIPKYEDGNTLIS